MNFVHHPMLADEQIAAAWDFADPMRSGPFGGENSLFNTLLETNAFRRLATIRFLGGIEYLLVPHPNGSRRRHTRLQHSIGVARLALHYADAVGLSLPERDLIGAAALLHDVGHAPLSHSLEQIFLREFQIDHRLANSVRHR